MGLTNNALMVSAFPKYLNEIIFCSAKYSISFSMHYMIYKWHFL